MNSNDLALVFTSKPIVFLISLVFIIWGGWYLWSTSGPIEYTPLNEAQTDNPEEEITPAEPGLQRLARKGQRLVGKHTPQQLDLSSEQMKALSALGPLPTTEKSLRERLKASREILTPEQIENLKAMKEEIWTDDLKQELRKISEQMKETDKERLREGLEKMRQDYESQINNTPQQKP
jgi:uncharacterized protein with von Willebrand factor type A (vWA) domain